MSSRFYVSCVLERQFRVGPLRTALLFLSHTRVHISISATKWAVIICHLCQDWPRGPAERASLLFHFPSKMAQFVLRNRILSLGDFIP